MIDLKRVYSKFAASRTKQALHSLSDRQLEDIGIHRDGIDDFVNEGLRD